MKPLGLFYLVAGALHFARPRVYVAIMPDRLPAKRALVYASGAAELAGGAGVLHPATRRPAGWWLIATLVAIFPANVNMAVNAERFRGIPEPLLWLRLPLQAVLIAWAYRGRGGAVREFRRARRCLAFAEAERSGAARHRLRCGRSRRRRGGATSPACAARACSRLALDEITVAARIAPSMANPAPTMNASRKPSVSALAIASPSATRLSVRELAIEARMARPSAPPTCCDVLIRPDARPASCASTLTAAIVIGTKAKPSPTAATSDGPRMSLT